MKYKELIKLADKGLVPPALLNTWPGNDPLLEAIQEVRAARPGFIAVMSILVTIATGGVTMLAGIASSKTVFFIGTGVFSVGVVGLLTLNNYGNKFGVDIHRWHKTSNFGRRLNWLVDILEAKLEDLRPLHESSIKLMAEQRLTRCARSILQAEAKWTGTPWAYGSTSEAKTWKAYFEEMYEGMHALGLVDGPYNRFFDQARREIEAGSYSFPQ